MIGERGICMELNLNGKQNTANQGHDTRAKGENGMYSRIPAPRLAAKDNQGIPASGTAIKGNQGIPAPGTAVRGNQGIPAPGTSARGNQGIPVRGTSGTPLQNGRNTAAGMGAANPVNPGRSNVSDAANRTDNNNAAGRTGAKAARIERSFGMDFTETINIVFAGILLSCLLISVVTYILDGAFTSASSGIGSSPSSSWPFSAKVEKKLQAERDLLLQSPTIGGVITELLDNYVLGYNAADETQEQGSDTVSAGDGTITTTNQPDAESSAPSGGASMLLDQGGGASGYENAASHEELVTQIDTALSASDYSFVGMKLAYKDDYGDLQGYPQSVVSYFTDYMAQNAEKRAEFISKIRDESYSGKNDSAFIIVLPVIRFTVNMAYDNTTVSVPGFGDQIVNSGQSAVIKPLLPCMYSVTLSNDQWSAPVTKEIETNLDELSYSLSVS